MKTSGPIIAMLVLIAYIACAQEALEIKKVFGGVKVLQGGQSLSMNQVSNIMKTNTEAFAVLKKAKSSGGAAQAFGAIGGALVGWPVGTAIGGGDPNWALAGVGAGFILLAIPFSSTSSKHLTKAVDIFNGKSGATGWMPVKMYVGPSLAGLKLQLRF